MRTLLLPEADALDKRYRQASAAARVHHPHGAGVQATDWKTESPSTMIPTPGRFELTRLAVARAGAMRYESAKRSPAWWATRALTSPAGAPGVDAIWRQRSFTRVLCGLRPQPLTRTGTVGHRPWLEHGQDNHLAQKPSFESAGSAILTPGRTDNTSRLDITDIQALIY
jgi:hypothetical protein